MKNEDVFYKGARIIVEQMKNPKTLSLMVEDAMYSTHFYVLKLGEDRGDADGYFFLFNFREEVLSPWVKGEIDYLQQMADGLKYVYEFAGQETMRCEIQQVLDAFTDDSLHTCYEGEYLINRMKFAQMLASIQALILLCKDREEIVV